ncbi:MAG TPA: MBL fold metallo-hydrolase [Terriglobales bacterium]|nr:MBL fold metallo-hydrolase [Terriglobales bacterium]
MRLSKTCMAVCILLFSAWAAAAGEPADVMTSFETVDLGHGVLAFIAPETRSQLVSGNSVAIFGEDGVLVVDTGEFPRLTRQMIAEIRKRTDKPVRFVVNTHWHNDHMMGNSVYRQEFPGVAIVSTPSTKANGDVYNPEFMELQKKSLPAATARIKQMLASGKNASGQALDAATTQRYKTLLADIEEFEPLMAEFRYESPNVTFTDRMDIDLGKRTVQVLFVGKGNTAGDAVVYVPDAKLLATGDLVVMPVPFATTSFVEDWIHTLDKLQTFEVANLVPGHGAVQHDFACVRTMEDTLKSLLSQVKNAVAQGKSLEETQQAVNLKREKAAAVGDSLVRSLNWDNFFQQSAVTSAYNELKGIPVDENPFPKKSQ